jgi:hypothetical protein
MIMDAQGFQNEANSRTIPLSQGQVAIVDAGDYEALSAVKWHAHWSKTAKTFYAVRMVRKADGKKARIYMHRHILGAPRGVQVDHRNGNGLDNLRDNLRLATRSQNQFNRTASANSACGLKGVNFHKQKKKWRAAIGVNNKTHWLGYFDTAEEAGSVYIEAAKRLHGEFAAW